MFDGKNWEELTPQEKKVVLFQNQKETLDLFLERNAISQEQHDQSLNDLRTKMGMEHILD